MKDSLSQNPFYAADGSFGYLRQIEGYRASAARIFPEVPPERLWGLPENDAWLMALFLECRPEKTFLLEVCDHASLVSLYLADRPEVIEAVCAGTDRAGAEDSFSPKALLAGFPAGEKVRLAGKGSPLPELSPPEGASTVAFVNLRPGREAVRGALEEVFEGNPRAVAVISGCRGEAGPFVQAGLVDFLESPRRGYLFRLFGDLCPGLAGCGLGVLYPESEAAPVEKTLERLKSLFSRRLDPLELLERERELVSIANSMKERALEAEEENEQLKAHYSSRRYRVADTIMERFQRFGGGK